MASPHPEHPHEHPELQGPSVSDDQPEARETDLLALGLLVFFVALIGIVGALLLLPALG